MLFLFNGGAGRVCAADARLRLSRPSCCLCSLIPGRGPARCGVGKVGVTAHVGFAGMRWSAFVGVGIDEHLPEATPAFQNVFTGTKMIVVACMLEQSEAMS